MPLVQLFGSMDTQKNKETIMSFLIHAGGEVVTRDDVQNVAVPAPSRRHKAIPHEFLIDSIDKVMDQIYPMFPLVKEQYALGKVDRNTGVPGQMFGLYTYDTGNPKYGLAIGFRNSYDKSLAAGIIGGANPFVCDNLCFSGDSFALHRKNTINAMGDVEHLMYSNAYAMLDDYRHMVSQFDVLEGVVVNQDTGYEVLGLMQGHEVIKPRQYLAAVDAWREPPQEDWVPRTALSLYNAVTEGTKKTNVSDVIKDLATPHKYMMNYFLEEVSA